VQARIFQAVETQEQRQGARESAPLLGAPSRKESSQRQVMAGKWNFSTPTKRGDQVAVTTPATMTRSTHAALIKYREHMEELGYNLTLAEAAGGLIAEGLQANGFLNRPEYVLPGHGE